MTSWMIGLLIVAGIIQWTTAVFTENTGTIVCSIFVSSFIFCLTFDSMEIMSIGFILFICGASALLSASLVHLFVISSRKNDVVFGIFFTIVFLIFYVFGAIFVVDFVGEELRYNENVIKIETPELHEKRYEIFSEDDLSMNDGEIEISSIVKYSDSSGKDGDYYIIYCKLSDNDEISVTPLVVKESSLEIIPLNSGVEASESEYLIKITETYYKEDRNKEPYEIEVDKEVTRYEAYLKESTIRKIPELTIEEENK